MEKKVSREVALPELVDFVNRFSKKPIEVDVAEKKYPDVLEAIMDGFVTFNDSGVPVYKLKHPVKDEKGEVAITEINFHTRIKPLTLANITKGLNLQEEQLMMQLKMTAYIIGQSLGMLDKFEPYDYDAISQIATVFS